MTTECTQKHFDFHPLQAREVVAQFDGGRITSDGGALLLREVERQTGIIRQFAACFTDHRDPELIEHTVEDLVGQRVYALALGYEDLNDHDELRHDPMLAAVAGKSDPTGSDRIRKRDKGKALAGKSTLNRLELTPRDASSESRYKKIVVDFEAVERLLVKVFLASHAEPPKKIILDLDATDDPLYGNQEGRFFHGYYQNYCYLPLYIFCGEFVLCAKLRPANIDASEGAVQELERIVREIRQVWPDVEIEIRADSGFCREEIMSWCEGNQVGYVLGLAKNARLVAELEAELRWAKERFEETHEAARTFKDFMYQTRESWSRPRRVVGKAEHLSKGANPRFVVTSRSAAEVDARALYEDVYCARGDMENRIKEQQLYLFADRTSTATMRGNQIRLWFSSVAYLLLQGLRRLGLKDTPLEKAQCQTIRLKLLKIGALIRVTVRRFWVSLAEGYPYKELFVTVYENLRRSVAFPLRC